jgi:hypothetical protein
VLHVLAIETATGAECRNGLDATKLIGWCLLGVYIALASGWCRRYNAGYLLWFCDVALLLTALGLIFRSALLVTAQLTAILVFHLAWNIDFWLYLVFGYSLTGATDYMFYPELSLPEKTLSFFSHVFIVPAAIYGAYVLGSPKKAWLLQWLQTLLVFVMTYLLTRPEENINWMFGTALHGLSPTVISPVFYYAFMVTVPLLIYKLTNGLVAFLIGAHGQNRVLDMPPCHSSSRLEERAPGTDRLAGLSPQGAAIAVLLAAGISLAVSRAADRKSTFDSALFDIAQDGKSALERIPSPSVAARVDHIAFGEAGSMREAPLLTWSGRELPKQWSGLDGKLHVHSKTLLLDVDARRIPSVPQEVTLHGGRAVPGSVVWAYVASDDFYLQKLPDLRGNKKTYAVRCEIGGHGVSEYVDALSGELYPSTGKNEILGNATGAIYVLGVVEALRGKVVVRSPYYLVKRRGIRFPDDVWFTSRDGQLIPFLSDPEKPLHARVAFQSSPDPERIPTHIFTCSFFGYQIRDLAQARDRFEGFLTPEGRPCSGVGWSSRGSLRYCTEEQGKMVTVRVDDHNRVGACTKKKSRR